MLNPLIANGPIVDEWTVEGNEGGTGYYMTNEAIVTGQNILPRFCWPSVCRTLGTSTFSLGSVLCEAILDDFRPEDRVFFKRISLNENESMVAEFYVPVDLCTPF